MIESIEANDSIREIEFQTEGGGIRGSIYTTLILIGLTLMFALPIGVGAAIYLNEYAPINRFTKLLRSLIETLTGVPSIIYGLMGLAIFVPLTVSLTNATGGNLISGAMTLAVILLPIIIRTTEESLKVVPDDFRQASLALGASQTQTTFKVVLPSALAGHFNGDAARHRPDHRRIRGACLRRRNGDQRRHQPDREIDVARRPYLEHDDRRTGEH
ncbi:MAG: ABC transporter permease subunit [Bacillus subtilis]|nr:ABC transporter permease subunit [Bacillus subtilis]